MTLSGGVRLQTDQTCGDDSARRIAAGLPTSPVSLECGRGAATSALRKVEKPRTNSY